MGLIRCYKCGEKVSDKSKACPHCGAEPKKQLSLLPLLPIALFVGIFVLMIGTPLRQKANKLVPQADLKIKKRVIPPVNWKDRNESDMAAIKAERFVKERLKSPSTAKFSGLFGEQPSVQLLADQKYIVKSFVDSQNEIGAIIRSNYTATVQQISENQWQFLSLDLD